MKVINVYDGVNVISNFQITEQEARNYIEFVLANVKIKNTPLVEITVKLCSDGKVDLGYLFKGARFERIRRVTGYLTGDVTSWNDAKQSEERERVKHTSKRIFYNENL